jgi:DNA mismatch endonuclease (patch repair protein)
MIRAPLTRSQVMSRIRSRDTNPELVVRRALHAAGLRYRLHVRALPGTPDIVLPARRVVVEVCGCFWHQHPGCPRALMPATRQEYWGPKLARNRERDRENERRLTSAGWRVLTIWECQAGDPAFLSRFVDGVLMSSRPVESPRAGTLLTHGAAEVIHRRPNLSRGL